MKNSKVLVVFYSKSGSTRAVSKYIAELTGWDIEEIQDTKSRKGIFGFIFSGRDAIKKKLTTINRINRNLEEYESVLIGTPVWASNMTPAVRTFVTENFRSIKNFAVFTTKSGEGEDAVFSDMENITGKKSLANLQMTVKEIKTGTYKVKMQDFVRNI